MKTRFLLLSAIFALLAFSACDKTPVETPEPGPVVPPVDSVVTPPADTSIAVPLTGYLAEVISDTIYTHEDFVTAFGSYIDNNLVYVFPDNAISILPLLNRIGNFEKTVLDSHFAKEQGTVSPKWGIKRVVFTVNSTDHNGEPCLITASAHYPCSLEKLFPHEIPIMASVGNVFAPGPNGVCSVSFPMCSGKVYQDAVMVVSDYEGMDPDKEHRQNVFEPEPLARQQLDADLAALELIEKDASVAMAKGFQTENFGVSRGAMVALAFAKYMDTQAPKEIQDALNFVGSYCATGPYAQQQLLENMITNRTDMRGISYLLPYFIFSNFRSSPDLFEQWSIEDFYSDEFKSFRIEYEGKEYSLAELTERPLTAVRVFLPYYQQMNNDPCRMIAADMLMPDSTLNLTSAKYLALLEATNRTDLSVGWTPKHPIRFGYAPSDELVPESSSNYTYNTLRKAADAVPGGPSVTRHRLYLPSSFAPGVHHDIASLYYMAYIAITPKPWLSNGILPDLW